MSLISELRRRNVLKVGLAYLAGSWLLLQVIDILQPVFSLNENALRYTVILLGIGVIPVLAISWAFEWTPDGLKRDQDAPPKTERARAQARTWDRVILVVMALALGFFAFDRFILSPQRDVALIEAATEAGAEIERTKVPAIVHESVAVLPFTNMSADQNNEYFSDGLTETLLHMLAQLPDLKVAARTSSFAYKNKNVDIRTIAITLGVAHILEGSVQKAGNRVRVTAQLIRADDGFHVWSQNYDRTMDDIFAIQDEIAADVANSLDSTILSANANAIAGVLTDDVSAYDIYLQALEQQAKGTIEALMQAERMFNEALNRDPNFVDAKIGIVRNNYMKAESSVGEFDSDIPISARLIAEILAADPDNLIARQHDLRLRSRIAIRDMEVRNYDELMNELLLTYQEGYGDPYIRRTVVAYLGHEDRNDEATKLLQDGLNADPLNVDFLIAHAYQLYFAGRLEEVVQPLLTALQVQPDNPQLYVYLGTAEFARKRVVDGLRYMRKAEILDPLSTDATNELALVFNEIGLYDYGDRWLEKFKSRTSDRSKIIDIETQIAAERGDEDTLRRIVPDALDAVFKGEIEDYSLTILLNEYTNIMLDAKRAQEGIDYIESFYPGISDIGGDAVVDWNTLYMQWTAVLPLLRSVSDDSKNRQDVEAFIAKYLEIGLEFNETDTQNVWKEYVLHGIDAARTAFFKSYTDDIYILSGQWHSFKRANWAKELRADPEIAAALAAREVRIAEIREQALAMMQEPEWQD